jgi:enamine deaminase RidA (YjgF/YER057c/UK114 family)
LTPESADSGWAVSRFGGDPPSPYEGKFSFSRIVCVGPFVMIGGTTSVDQHGHVLGETPYEQTIEIVRKLGHELLRVGATPGDVIQLRVYVTDISRAEEVGLALGEAFDEARPLMTMVEVAALIDPRMLVEIELVAHRGG